MSNIKFFLAALSIILLISCKKEKDSEDISRVTNYPLITLNGPEVASIVVGETYDDPGAEAEEGGNTIPVEVTDNIDNQTVGLYAITYSAENQDGFKASAERTIAVIPEEETPGLDLSGTYYNAASDLEAATTRLDAGIYQSSNVMGAGYGAIVQAYIICSTTDEVIIPLQSTPFGRLEGEGEYDESTETFAWELRFLDQPGVLVVNSEWVKQ